MMFPLSRLARPASTIRGAIIAGFAVVFTLWLASGYELVRSLRDTDQRIAAGRLAFHEDQEVLDAVRTSVLLGSVFLRDALIDPTAANPEFYRQELTDIRDDVNRVLPDYLPLVGSSLEEEHWDRLQLELDRYWQSSEAIFAGDAPLDSGRAATLLQQRTVPARESILEIVDSLSALQHVSEARHDEEMLQLYSAAQTRVLALASLAIVLGLIVAWAASRHVGGLERELERQRAAENHHRLDLKRLSAKLVQVQEEERRSLSRELHDAVGQALTAIKMEMGVALRRVGTDPRARQALDDARALAESTLQSVRDLSQLLHPSTLDDFGLPDTLAAHLRSFSTRTGIRAQLTHERMDGRLPENLEVCVYRIVQEALTNVARHSGASSCTVALVQRNDSLHLTIEDDGRGIGIAVVHPPGSPRRGLGLIGMRERAEALDGSFVVENRREGGTRLTVWLPVVATAATSESSPQQLAG
jgi:signal transduction histidine kinase